MPDTPLCPVLAYSRMISLTPALPGEPAFGVPYKGFSKKAIYAKFKAVLEACRLDSGKLSFHSLRRESASLASRRCRMLRLWHLLPGQLEVGVL